MRIIAGAVVLIAVVLAPGAVEAWECTPLPPPCAHMFSAGPVFVGTPIKIARSKQVQQTTFSVSELFHGAIGKTAVVTTTTGDIGGTPEPAFAIGTAYIVYAFADGTTPTLATGPCMGTRPAADAAEDLAFGRSIPQRALGVVDGTIEAFDEAVAWKRTPVAGVDVEVGGTTQRARSGADGRFHFDLPPGKYQLKVVSTIVVAPDHELAEIDLPVAAACAVPQIDVRWNGRIAGRITDLGGKPLANVQVGAVDAGSSLGNSVAISAADGTYLIEGVWAGSYRVGVSLPGYGGPQPSSAYPTTYFPGRSDPAQATIVTVAHAKLTPAIDFSIPPPLPVFRVGGIVTSALHKPVPGYDVRIDVPGSYTTSVRTDDSGRYRYDVVSGRDIVVAVCSAKVTRPKCTEVKRTVSGPVVLDLVVPREPDQNSK